MMNFGWWLIQHAPLPLLLISGVVAAVFLYRVFGWRAAVAAVAVTLVSLLTKNSHQAGWDARDRKGHEDAKKIISKGSAARDGADNADPERLHDDDGFRRD